MNLFKTMPLPLQKRVLVCMMLTAALLAAAIALLLIFNIALALPFLLLAALSAADAAGICRASARNECLSLAGTVLKIEHSILFRCPKAVLFETNGKVLRFLLQNQFHAPREGAHITLYVLESTLLYEWQGIRHLSSYLALEMN